MIPPEFDQYEGLAMMGAARTGPVQLQRLRESLAGKRPLAAQTRLLLEMLRRGRLTLEDLTALANRDRRAR